MSLNGGCSQVKAASETYIDPFQVNLLSDRPPSSCVSSGLKLLDSNKRSHRFLVLKLVEKLSQMCCTTWMCCAEQRYERIGFNHFITNEYLIEQRAHIRPSLLSIGTE